jgi:phosphotransferase system  glucose/maltose/N-acetylglucosamine-specific IIC component
MSADPTAAPKAEEPPKSLLERAGAALPIALTAIATAFAGMSTSELQRAMFWRSFAAQDQAKATSQWTYAGFKRDRALICETTAVQLRAGGATWTPPAGADPAVADWLTGKASPTGQLPRVSDPRLEQLLKDIRERAPEAALLQQAGAIPQAVINAAIDDAEKAVEQLDGEWKPTLDAALKLAAAGGTPAQAARFDLDNRRYRVEAGLNQGVGYLYEARVKVSSAESNRHQGKSENFFYAMLAAQIGATIASLALARKEKSVLWAVAGGAGLVALVIGAYVYLSA